MLVYCLHQFVFASIFRFIVRGPNPGNSPLLKEKTHTGYIKKKNKNTRQYIVLTG